MTRRQTHFSFSTKPSYAADDFIRAPCNDMAYDALVRGQNLGAASVLWGPTGSGKSHLATMWAKRFSAVTIPLSELPELLKNNKIQDSANYVIDEVDQLTAPTQEALFHLYNRLQNGHGHVLLTAQHAPETWGIDLPDLSSRILACPQLVVSLPDEATILMVLAKLFSDRHMHPQGRSLSFMVKRIDRSFKNLVPLVDWIDQETLRYKRRLTVPLMKHLLEGYHDNQHLKGQQ